MKHLLKIHKVLAAIAVMWVAPFCGCSTDSGTPDNQDLASLSVSQGESKHEGGEHGGESGEHGRREPTWSRSVAHCRKLRVDSSMCDSAR